LPSQQFLTPAVKLLLLNDGIHILDLKNLYIDAGIEQLAGMIQTTKQR
jgi:hypothetical protein